MAATRDHSTRWELSTGPLWLVGLRFHQSRGEARQEPLPPGPEEGHTGCSLRKWGNFHTGTARKSQLVA